MNYLIWIGIGFCISQSAIFSGLNLAFFSISKLQLEIEINKQNKDALKIAKLRDDSNLLLTTILWGNVGINVLLTLLSHSVMAGVAAFIFSTFIITLMGEIIPQAYFSRHAMRTASLLSPVIRSYRFLLYPVAKPTSLLLDKWLGTEAIQYFQEQDMRELLKMHVEAPETNIAHMEGRGALNFLAIDDLSITEEGEVIFPASILPLNFIDDKPVFPEIGHSCDAPFLHKIQKGEKKWIVLTDMEGVPRLTLNSNSFLRAALFEKAGFNPLEFCHRPIIIRNPKVSIGEAILEFKVESKIPGDDVVDKDIILFWGEQKRIVTGTDILGRLLRGIVQN
ncbi:MAG: CNNM domain-containing protein [Nitrospinota bacterium]|nr:DUF21 domain-containing protein [Nitrospinota bacterium]